MANSSSTSQSTSAATTTTGGSNSALIICRNKHWRYISAFHGPWLQMPIELMETIAHMNYNAPRPRPIDPAVFFDIAKIRKLADEATNLAVRAASDIASPTLTNVNGSYQNHSPLYSLNMGSSGHGDKLSKGRKFKMRQQACQKLSRAYRLDEIASSVVTMQGASSLEEVGSHVLQREKSDYDAKYVHFFHEKIPSRQLAESTSIEPLSDIITNGPRGPEVLRTRATVKIFKNDLPGAIQDLTEALSACRFQLGSHISNQNSALDRKGGSSSRRQQDVILSEEEQPSSLEGQLYFHRASVHLSLASAEVENSLAPLDTTTSTTNSGDDDGSHAAARRFEAQKLVKTYAKRALRDYLSFISLFEYSPNMPIKFAREFNDRVNAASQHSRSYRTAEPSSSPQDPHTIYSLAELFEAVQPSGIPPYPSSDNSKDGQPKGNTTNNTCEWATYHPLLTEALHCFLLAHCLAQTSAKEIQRHAYMVARLTRLSDGFPLFQAIRSAARGDWVEVLQGAGSWLSLDGSWEKLCYPAPLPLLSDQNGLKQKLLAESSDRSLGNAAELADAAATVTTPRNKVPQDGPAVSSPQMPPLRRWSGDDCKDYSAATERAGLIVRWVLEVPMVTGTARRKKRTKKPSTTPVAGGTESTNVDDD